MTGDARGAESGIRAAQRADQSCQRMILSFLVSQRIHALELDADREIVAGAAPGIIRFTCVPGAQVKRHVLREPAAAVDPFLPFEPGDTAVNPRIDPRSYQITPDGSFAVFTTTSKVMLTAGTDKNGKADVFRRDLLATRVFDPNSGGTTANPAALQLVSVNFRNSTTAPAA